MGGACGEVKHVGIRVRVCSVPCFAAGAVTAEPTSF